jgi:transketolase
MTVIAPADAEEARKAVLAAARATGPVYLRFGRAPTPVFTTPETPFAIGTALSLYETDAPQVALLATGSLSHTALLAARALATKGVEASVLHVPTVKPLDDAAVLTAAQRAGRVVTIEEHQIMGGFGSAVAEYLSHTHPVPVLRLGLTDEFGQSGTPTELLAHYGLDTESIVKRVKAFLTHSPL